MTDTVTMDQFIAAQRISMTAERVGCNPNMDDSRDMDHWKVVLTRRHDGGERSGLIAARMTTYFSMGYAHKGKEPKTAEVLDCLSSDASVEGNGTFEDFCSELGYDSDSRKAEKIYKACQHGTARLKRFLGEDAFQALVYGTERI